MDDKKLLFIVNPRAGKTKSLAPLFDAAAIYSEAGYLVSVRKTTHRGEATELAELLGPEFDVVVCHGGDGTLNEAANGIIRAEAGNRTLLSVVPAGTGNDFVRTFPEKGCVTTVDAMRYRYFADAEGKELLGDRYAMNIINFGFDSRVVKKTGFYKSIFPGSAAYIAGVADTLCRRV